MITLLQSIIVSCQMFSTGKVHLNIDTLADVKNTDFMKAKMLKLKQCITNAFIVLSLIFALQNINNYCLNVPEKIFFTALQNRILNTCVFIKL